MALIKLNNRSSEDNAIHGRRNLIINGAMQVAQRGTSSTAVTAGGYYTVDRYRLSYNDGLDELQFTQEQSTDAPTGFSNSLKLTVTTAETTLAAAERVRLQQRIEGQNLQHLKYGTSDAEYLTLSFYVKSNVTGTYGIHLDNDDSARAVCATYTINVANTWEKKTVSIAGDTTGSFNNDNDRALDISWVLVAGTDYTSGTLATSWESNTIANNAPSGQVNLVDTVSNSWQITGVQLEVGDTATPFEHRSYAEDLRDCQRYFISTNPNTLGDAAVNQSAYICGTGYNSRARFTYYYPTPMRTKPAGTLVDASGNGNVSWWNSTSRTDYSGSWTFENSVTCASYYSSTTAGTGVNGKALLATMGDESSDTSHYLELTAEL